MYVYTLVKPSQIEFDSNRPLVLHAHADGRSDGQVYRQCDMEQSEYYSSTVAIRVIFEYALVYLLMTVALCFSIHYLM